MIRINIHEAKTQLSRYLEKLEKGERIVLCRRNVAIAELKLVENRNPVKRRIGTAKGQFAVPPAFFDPLPREIQEAFSGTAE